MTVKDLDQSIEFYNTLFGQVPSVVKPDYAKWMLDDPAVNFAIQVSDDGSKTGIGHLGLQADSADGLADISTRLKSAGAQTIDQHATTCCYAVSDKTWVEDPTGVRWETFFTHGTATTFGEDEARTELEAAKAAQGNGGCC